MSRKKKNVNKPHHRRCIFEALENRRLLAGDVKVSFIAGKATVTGDNLDNAIVITSAGVRAVANTNTTINSGAGPFVFGAAITSLKVNMKGGNDNVTLGDKPLGTALTVNGKAEVKLGSGNDTILYQNTTVTQKLHIHKGGGRDTVRTGTGNNIGKLKPKVPATASITGPATINEGSSVTINLSATPQNKKDVVTQWSIDWGDGSAAQIVNGNPTTATHKYAIADDYVITVTATVAKKGNKKDTFLVDADFDLQVVNVPPTVALNSPGSRNEDGAVTLTGSYTDPGLTQGHRVTVSWDDPNSVDDSIFEIGATNGAGLAGTTFPSTGNDTTTTLTVTAVNLTTGVVNFTVSHQYVDDGIAPGNGTPNDDSTIQVTVEDFAAPIDFSDPALSSGTNSVNVTINNVVPTVAVSPITSIVEAATATVSGSFTDIGSLDVHTVTIAWGDGTQSVFNVPATSTPLTVGQAIAQSSGVAATLTIAAGLNTTTGFVPFSAQHAYAQNGSFTVTITVADDDAGSGSGSSTLIVTNAVPTVTNVVVNTPITEASAATVTGQFTDAGVNDTHTVTVNWADQNSPTNSVFQLGATNTLTNGQTFNSTTGDGAVLTITAAPAAGGVVTYSIATHTYRDDGLAPGNGTASDISPITVTVADPDSSGNGGANLTVNNQVPTISTQPVATAATVGILDNASISTAGFTDVGLADTHTVTVNWGDGSTSSFSLGATSTLTNGQSFNSTTGDGATLTLTAAPAAGGVVTFSVGNHKYATAGAKNVTVTVADDDLGNVASNVVVITVVAPTVTLIAPAAITENGVATLTGNFTDVGLDDTHTVTVTWGDLNNPTNSVFSLGTTSTLTNGQTFNSTSGDGAVLTLTAAPTAAGVVAFSVTPHRYVDDGPAPGNILPSDQSNITVTVVAGDGASANNLTTITVNNSQPGVDLGAPAAPPTATVPFTVTGNTFTDVGLRDAHVLVIDWGAPAGAISSFSIPPTNVLVVGTVIPSSTPGDNTSIAITAINATTGVVTFSVTHTYPAAAAGITINATITDDDSGVGTDSVGPIIIT